MEKIFFPGQEVVGDHGWVVIDFLRLGRSGFVEEEKRSIEVLKSPPKKQKRVDWFYLDDKGFYSCQGSLWTLS